MHKYPIQKELLTTSPRTRCPEGIGRPTPSGLGSAQVNTVRRKTYKQYQPEDITAALYLVATSQASIIQAAKQFNIPTRTLYQRIYNIKKLYALGREPDPSGVGRSTSRRGFFGQQKAGHRRLVQRSRINASIKKGAVYRVVEAAQQSLYFK